jgi:putative endonuclease
MRLPWQNKKSTAIGQQAEQQALRFLKQQGLKLITHNYYCRQGEIDLIMTDQQTLVFIEVRYRKNAHYGSGAESVTNSKQKKVRRTAEHYLLHKTKSPAPACRFDVVAIYPSDTAQSSLQFDWIKNAF